MGSLLSTYQSGIEGSGGARKSYHELAREGVLESTDTQITEVHRLKMFLGQNQNTIQYLSDQASSLEAQRAQALNLKNLAVQWRGHSQNTMELEISVQTAAERMRDLFNTRRGDEAIFSGTRIDQLPVPDSLLAESNIVDGQVTNRYYMGNNTERSVNISNHYALSYQVHAGMEAQMNHVAALHKMLEANQGEDDEAMEQAIDYLDIALENYSRQITQVNLSINTVMNYNAIHEDRLTITSDHKDTALTSSLEDLITQMANTEAQLTAMSRYWIKQFDMQLIKFL
jgi:hypothetical protein